MKKFRNGYEVITTGTSVFGLMLGFILIFLAVLVLFLTREEFEYDYVDMNGNQGVSKHCETPSMGNMRCDVEGGKVQVNYYKGRKVNGN